MLTLFLDVSFPYRIEPRQFVIQGKWISPSVNSVSCNWLQQLGSIYTQRAPLHVSHGSLSRGREIPTSFHFEGFNNQQTVQVSNKLNLDSYNRFCYYGGLLILRWFTMCPTVKIKVSKIGNIKCRQLRPIVAELRGFISQSGGFRLCSCIPGVPDFITNLWVRRCSLFRALELLYNRANWWRSVACVFRRHRTKFHYAVGWVSPLILVFRKRRFYKKSSGKFGSDRVPPKLKQSRKISSARNSARDGCSGSKLQRFPHTKSPVRTCSNQVSKCIQLRRTNMSATVLKDSVTR